MHWRRAARAEVCPECIPQGGRDPPGSRLSSVEFPRKLKMGDRRLKIGFAQRFGVTFHAFGTNLCDNKAVLRF